MLARSGMRLCLSSSFSPVHFLSDLTEYRLWGTQPALSQGTGEVIYSSVLMNKIVNGLENFFFSIQLFLPEVWWPGLWEASAWTQQTATTLPAWAARELMTSTSLTTTTLNSFQNSLLPGPVSLSWTTCVTDATTCSGTTTSTVSVGEHCIAAIALSNLVFLQFLY